MQGDPQPHLSCLQNLTLTDRSALRAAHGRDGPSSTTSPPSPAHRQVPHFLP